jgi:hypothetical protein
MMVMREMELALTRSALILLKFIFDQSPGMSSQFKRAKVEEE